MNEHAKIKVTAARWLIEYVDQRDHLNRQLHELLENAREDARAIIDEKVRDEVLRILSGGWS